MCSSLFELFRDCLGDKGYVQSETETYFDDRTRLYGMFHSKTSEKVRHSVLQAFMKEDGHVRVLFCTIAFGMGIDVKGVNHVVHIGPANDLEDYLQESGRAGRNLDNQSFVTIVKFPRCTAGNVGEAMKAYVKEQSKCRRLMLLSPFEGKCVFNGPKHMCCDNCAKLCKCSCECSNEFAACLLIKN
jgi:superfamily II DNA or RNA helicase